MKTTYEIYLAKKYISKEEWLQLIKIISDYQGILKNWELIISVQKNYIHYFIKTEYNLPSQLNNLPSFFFKETNNINIEKHIHSIPTIIPIDNNIVNIIETFELKNKGKLIYSTIYFRKIYEDKILSKIYIYLTKNKTLKKYRTLLSLPSNILSINFEENKRFIYKKVPKYLDITKAQYLLTTKSESTIFKIDTFPILQGNFYLNIDNYDFYKHSLVIGASGSGKSKFISLFIYNISKHIEYKDKYKIVVIDPHADLKNSIGGIANIIDFQTKNTSLNLFNSNNKDIIISTELLLELLKSLILSQYNSKLERVLRHSIYILLADNNFNFTTLRTLILDLEYRNNLIKKLKYIIPISIIDFFLKEFNDIKTKYYGEAISPIIALIDEIEMLPVFNQENINTNIKDTINNNFLTLFSLDRTKLGEKITKTISGLIMEQLFILIQNHTFNEHIIFVIDEVSIIESPILQRFLSESRKYNLSLILIGQYFNQISNNLKSAIFSNCMNYYIFKTSKIDANILVDNLDINIPLDNTKEQKTKLLTELKAKECLLRITSNGILLPAIKGESIDFKDIPSSNTNIDTINFQTNTSTINSKKDNFTINSNINLKDILISTSSNRNKGGINERNKST